MTGAPPTLAAALLAAFATPCAGLAGFAARRPPSAGWRRTQCGSPIAGADIPSRWAAEVSADEPPLPAYPRPQMVRARSDDEDFGVLRDRGDPSTWVNLNGLWEWQAHDDAAAAPPFGRTLMGSILVPFPAESCLSGIAPRRSKDVVKKMWYRLVFDLLHEGDGRLLLHFGAVDWQTNVWFNGHELGNHTGGYDGFSFDVTDFLRPAGNELLVFVFDPSDHGVQPHGKQFMSAIDHPQGDVYTPSSGIWQTVWLEEVPDIYIEALAIDQASMSTVKLTAWLGRGGSGFSPAEAVTVKLFEPGTRHEIASGQGTSGHPIAVKVPSPQLWSPSSPTLYDVEVAAGGDTVFAYFGLRTFALSDASDSTKRPMLNSGFTFLVGMLDQSFWPDGLYTAPTDGALESDLLAAKAFGFNMLRLHQKVNPERWYYHADRHGIVVLQDMPQKYGDAKPDLIPFFVEDLKRMIAGRSNHPSIVQWVAFNEEDCWQVFTEPPFDMRGIVDVIGQLDPTRIVDASSGGHDKKHLGAVNDIHSYPSPRDVRPSASQYAMIGEFGGLGTFVAGREWVPHGCFAYLKAKSPADMAARYITMASWFEANVDHVSASVYTQVTDIERECDGFLNYDRTSKFDEAQTAALKAANEAIVRAGRRASAYVGRNATVPSRLYI